MDKGKDIIIRIIGLITIFTTIVWLGHWLNSLGNNYFLGIHCGTFISGVLILLMISDSYAQVQEVHYGIMTRLGEQLKGTYGEGFRFKIPFIEQMKMISTELQAMETRVQFTSEDKLRIVIPGSLQFRADPNVIDSAGKNVFFTVSEQARKEGLQSDVQAKLGGLGGCYGGEKFITSRQAVGDLIKSVLRLKAPLHLNHKAGDTERCGIESGCQNGEKIDIKDLIDFYNAHWRKVKEILSHEQDDPESISEIERRYGIDIITYALANVEFSKETEGAQEEEKQAGYREKSGSIILDLAKSAKIGLPGISDQQALNFAEATLRPETPRRMISVEGETGVAGGLLDVLGRRS